MKCHKDILNSVLFFNKFILVTVASSYLYVHAVADRPFFPSTGCASGQVWVSHTLAPPSLAWDWHTWAGPLTGAGTHGAQ